MADTQIYSHEEIQRYLQHKMSPQEMHEFEKTLMNDPFLADALEGFSAGDPLLAQEHLRAIERSVATERPAGKVVQLAAQKSAWWKIAAIIIVIISAAAITYSVFDRQEALDNKNQIAASTPATVPAKNDTISSIDKPLAHLEALPRKKSVRRNISPIVRTDGARSFGYSRQIPTPEQRGLDSSESNVGLMAAASSPPLVANNEFASAKRMTATNATAQNQFKEKATASAQTIKGPDSILQTDQNSLADIVVTNIIKKKKRSAATILIDSSIASQPVGGWKNFRQYLNQHLDSLKTIDQGNYLSEIELEFSIDKQGRPINIKTPAELDTISAEKAVKILAEGPRWKNTKKDKKVKMTIAF